MLEAISVIVMGQTPTDLIEKKSFVNDILGYHKAESCFSEMVAKYDPDFASYDDTILECHLTNGYLEVPNVCTIIIASDT